MRSKSEATQKAYVSAIRLLAVVNDLEQEIRQTLELPTWGEWRKAPLITFLKQINMADDEQAKAFRQTV